MPSTKTAFRIPKQYEAVFVKLIRLNDETAEELISLLDVPPPTFSPENLMSRLSLEVEHLSISDAREIFDLLFSLSGVRFQSEKTIDEFVDEVLQAFETTENEQLKLDDDAARHFRERLESLLKGQTFNIATRALDLIFEHEHTLQGLRIISDIRSVYTSSPEDEPSAAIIVHMLKIRYVEGEAIKEFFVALDTADLQILKDIIQRAEKKTESLKETLARVSIPYVDA